MDMNSRKQYFLTLQTQYLQADKKGKSKILDEFVRNTTHHRKYVITAFNQKGTLIKLKRVRHKKYGDEILSPLIKLYEIFDYPCGQRLKPMITEELDRLIKFKELSLSEDIISKLKTMSSATIDRKLKAYKNHILKGKSLTKPGTLLKRQIKVQCRTWNNNVIGFMEADTVGHHGGCLAGDFINSLSMTEIISGWWEAEAMMTKGKTETVQAIDKIKQRLPFNLLGIDSDNGTEFINYPLHDYCKEKNITFTRSRPYHSNDNAHVEQKNWTHIRKVLGYHRHDHLIELELINGLYRNELRLFKNFFQPQMRIIKKIKDEQGRVIKKEREVPLTPFKKLLLSDQISQQKKNELTAEYEKLNPAALKRAIDNKVNKIIMAYHAKVAIRNKAKNQNLQTESEVMMVRS